MLVKRLALLSFLALGTPVWAADPVSPDLRDMMSARNVAMGGAYESLGYGAEAIDGNPAAMSIYKRYTIEASGAWDIPVGYVTGTLGLLDSTNTLAMGVSYHFATFGQYDERRYAHITTLALSYAIADWLHLGLAGRSDILVGGTNTNSVTVNAGLILHPAEWLSLGFSGHNLIYNYNIDLPRYFVASASALLFGQLTPAFDWHLDFNQQTPRYSFHAGLEWLIAQIIPVRVGYERDNIMGHQYLSGGLGYFSGGSGIDLAYRHELDNGRQVPGRMVSLTVKLQL